MSWTLTYTGKKFTPTKKMELDDISIVDIAHALSNLCRFAGHSKIFYSVAQHSVYVSFVMEMMGLDKEKCLAGLLHDATEAYLIDLPQPIKRLPEMKYYCDMEDNLAEEIAHAFGFIGAEVFKDAKKADIIMLATEARDLMNDPKDWESLKDIQPANFYIEQMTPDQANLFFLERFHALGGRHV